MMWKNHFFQHVLVQHTGHQYQHLKLFISTSKFLTLHTHETPVIARNFFETKQANLVSLPVEWLFFRNTKSNQMKIKKFMAIKHTEYIHTFFFQLWKICSNFQRTNHEKPSIQLSLFLNNFQLFCLFPNPWQEHNRGMYFFYLERRSKMADKKKEKKNLTPPQKTASFLLFVTFTDTSLAQTYEFL